MRINSILFIVNFILFYVTLFIINGDLCSNYSLVFLNYFAFICLICALNHILKSPFIEILLITTTMSISARIPVLCNGDYYTFTEPSRAALVIDNESFNLLIVFLSLQLMIFALSIVLLIPKIRVLPERKRISLKAERRHILILFLIVAIHFINRLGSSYGDKSIGSLGKILLSIINLDMVVITIAVLFVIFKLKLSSKLVLFFLIILVMYIRTFIDGSKSAIYYTGWYFLFASYFVKSDIVIANGKLSRLGFIVGPAFIYLSIQGFFLGLQSRAAARFVRFDIEVAKENLLGFISFRTGWLDFYLEGISNYRYDAVYTFENYFFAILDKLTPGLSFGNHHFVSKKLPLIYGHDPTSGNKSESITIFAESYNLFSVAFPFYFIFLCLLIRFVLLKLKIRFKIESDFYYVLGAAIVLRFFFSLIEGFGFDMSFIIYFVYSFLYVAFYKVLNSMTFGRPRT